MTEQQKQQIRALFLQCVAPERMEGVKWALDRGMIKDCHIHAFLCQKLYTAEIEKTKGDGRKYGDKKQAISEVQKYLPLSERRIKTLIK